MKMRGLLLIGLLVMLLSSCGSKLEDVQFEFPTASACNDDALDYIELEALEFPDSIDKGYLYSFVFDYGQYSFVFRNPDSENARDEFVTRGAFGNQFHNEDGAYLRTEVPEGYYLYSVTYKYASQCRDSVDLEEMHVSLNKSFVYYSETEYTEAEFMEAHADLFE